MHHKIDRSASWQIIGWNTGIRGATHRAPIPQANSPVQGTGWSETRRQSHGFAGKFVQWNAIDFFYDWKNIEVYLRSQSCSRICRENNKIDTKRDYSKGFFSNIEEKESNKGLIKKIVTLKNCIEWIATSFSWKKISISGTINEIFSIFFCTCYFVQVSGPSTFKVRDLKADVENVVFTFKVNFEKLHFQGKYQIDARVLLLKLTGEGNITGTFSK